MAGITYEDAFWRPAPGGQAIPGMSVTEPTAATSWRAAPGGQGVPGMTAFEPTPSGPVSNPSIRPGIPSPEAQAYQASRATPTAPTPTAPAAPQSSTLRNVLTGGRVAAGLGAAAAAVPEAIETAKVVNAGGSTADVATQAAQGVGRVGAAGAGAALGAKGGAALGAGIGTMILPGIGTAAGGALGGLAGGVVGGWGGYKAADAAIGAGRSALGSDPRSPYQQIVDGEGAKPSMAAAILDPQPRATQADVRRVDNRLAAADPATVAAAATTTPAAAPGAPGNVTTSQDRIDQMTRDAAFRREMTARQQEQNIASGREMAPGMVAIDGAGAAADSRNQFFEQANLRNALNQTIMTRRGPVPNEVAVRAAMAPIEQRAQARREGMRNQAQLQEASMRSADTRRGQDLEATATERRDRTTLRGQDLELFGKQVTATNARAIAQNEQGNKDRQFQLDVQKFGVETANKNREARASEQKAVDDNLAGMFRTTDAKGNDVADTARIAGYKQAMQTTLGAIINAHKSSGDPNRVRIAQELENRGMAAMTPQEHAQFKQLYDARERIRQSSGLVRGSASYVDSDNLLDFAQRPGDEGVEQRTLGGNRIRMRGGSEVSVNDLRYTEPSNRLLPDWFKTRDNDLVRGLRMQ